MPALTLNNGRRIDAWICDDEGNRLLELGDPNQHVQVQVRALEDPYDPIQGQGSRREYYHFLSCQVASEPGKRFSVHYRISKEIRRKYNLQLSLYLDGEECTLNDTMMDRKEVEEDKYGVFELDKERGYFAFGNVTYTDDEELSDDEDKRIGEIELRFETYKTSKRASTVSRKAKIQRDRPEGSDPLQGKKVDERKPEGGPAQVPMHCVVFVPPSPSDVDAGHEADEESESSDSEDENGDLKPHWTHTWVAEGIKPYLRTKFFYRSMAALTAMGMVQQPEPAPHPPYRDDDDSNGSSSDSDYDGGPRGALRARRQAATPAQHVPARALRSSTRGRSASALPPAAEGEATFESAGNVPALEEGNDELQVASGLPRFSPAGASVLPLPGQAREMTPNGGVHADPQPVNRLPSLPAIAVQQEDSDVVEGIGGHSETRDATDPEGEEFDELDSDTATSTPAPAPRASSLPIRENDVTTDSAEGQANVNDVSSYTGTPSFEIEERLLFFERQIAACDYAEQLRTAEKESLVEYFSALGMTVTSDHPEFQATNSLEATRRRRAELLEAGAECLASIKPGFRGSQALSAPVQASKKVKVKKEDVKTEEKLNIKEEDAGERPTQSLKRRAPEQERQYNECKQLKAEDKKVKLEISAQACLQGPGVSADMVIDLTGDDDSD